MFGWIKDQRLPVVLAVLGFVLAIAGFFQISDITKLDITPYESPVYYVVALGIALLVTSVALFLADKRKVKLPTDLNQQPKVLSKSVFLSAPMSMFVEVGRPEDYKKSREQVLKVVAALKRECGIEDVFYAGELIVDATQFDLPGASLKDDFRKIQEREFFVLFWPEKFASRSSLVEAGIAMTLNKKCLYLVRKEDDLPFLLQGAQNATRNVKVVKYTDVANLLHIIRINRNNILDFERIG